MTQRPIDWYEETDWLHAALRGDGAFLLTNTPAGARNVMTIGWGLVGVGWGVPLFVALVRKSRYTHECIQSAASFAVSVPLPGELKQALAFCGTASGRDTDKVAASGLHVAPASAIDAAIVADCGLHYECEIVARTQQQRGDFAAQRILDTIYLHGDNHHQAVFGQIRSAYVTRERGGGTPGGGRS